MIKKVSINITFIILVSYFISPVITLVSFAQAIKKNDSISLSKFIDFPLLREDLKYQLSSYLNTKAVNKLSGTNNVKLKMYVISPIINNIVDASIKSTITPKGLYFILKNGKFSDVETFMPSDTLDQNKKNKLEYSIYYSSLNNFVLSTRPTKFNRPVIASWRRSKLFGWKLYSIKLPLK